MNAALAQSPQSVPKTVLIADDEPHMRLLVAATVESQEYMVLEAADGDEAWELIQRFHPDVCLLDVQMPGKTGVELTQAIKSDPELARTRVIMLTSQAQAADIQRGLSAGANLYLTKPFSPLELLLAVEQAIES